MNIRARWALLALSLCTATLLATSANAEDGLYFEAGGYYTELDTDFNPSDIDWGDDFDEIKAYFDDSSSGFNLGTGWRFNNWLAVDVGYWDLGNFNSKRLPDGDTISYDLTAYSLGTMVSVPLLIVDVYGRAGIALWNSDSRHIDDDGTDTYYGVGAALNFLGSLDLYAEYMRFNLKTTVDTFGIGIRLTF